MRSGFIGTEIGKLRGLGQGNRTWSSSSYGNPITAYYLLFGADRVWTANGDNSGIRHDAFSLRCLAS